MIVSRELYEAALLINQPGTHTGTHTGTVYQPGLPAHEAALAGGIARRNGKFIELTHKGEEVVRLE